MGTYANFLIEAKLPDGEWHLLTGYVPFKEETVTTYDFEGKPIKSNSVPDFWNEKGVQLKKADISLCLQGYVRDLFSNTYFNNSNLNSRGFPADMSEGAKSIFDKKLKKIEADNKAYFEKYGVEKTWGGKWWWGESYATIDELEELLNKNIKKWQADIKKAIEENFAELISDVVLSDFYTIQQIMEKFSMTHAAVLSFVQRHNVSRKTILRKVYYSRDEIDKLKDPLKDEEYYTYPQINQVYGLTKDQIAYYTHAYHLTTGKKGKFTLINKEEFDAIMRNRSKDGHIVKNTSTEDATIDALLKRKEDEKQARIPAGYVSIQQIAEKYAMTVKHVQKITCSMAIKEKKSIGGYNYFPSEVIEKAFAKYEANPWVKLWISAKDMEEHYMMTPEARRSFAYRHKIPTKQVKGKVFYSKEAIDKVKSDDFESRDKYYSVEEIMERYGATRSTVYSKVKYYKVGKVHKAQFSYFNKEDIDRIFEKNRGKN